MSTAKPKRDSTTTTPDASQGFSAPPQLGYGHGDNSFTLQAIMEMQKSMGEMNANILTMKGSVDGLRTKVEDLVNWKHRILGGVAVLAALLALLSFLIGKFSDNVSFKSASAQTEGAAPAIPPVVEKK
jgi:hypothetical protein